MVESGTTQVSPISGPAAGRGTARDAVASFLKFTVDTPDLKKAKLHLTRRSATSGIMETSAVPAGATYTLGAEEADDLGTRIPVSVRSPVPGGAPQEMTVPVIVVEEEGQWKVDLHATMERVFGGSMSVLGQALGAMGQAMATAMSGVQGALAAGLGDQAGAEEPSRMAEAAHALKKSKRVVKKKPPAGKKAPSAKRKTPPKKPAKKGKSARKTASRPRITKKRAPKKRR